MATQQETRNLVICVDGTSNKFSDKNTNVVRLYECLKKDDLQKTYYMSGIGTFVMPPWRLAVFLKRIIISAIDLVVAKNLEEVIIDAYRWLADTYQPGDRIFLFGFSRGAYQVRALAAMIQSVGLIHAGNQKQIPFAWELYKTRKWDKEKHRGMVDQFKSTFSRTVDVYFLGAWDTVSSVGLYRRQLLPKTLQRDHIEHFRHALALDERRVKFLPEYAIDGGWGKNTSKDVWFIGTHSDIGGMKSELESDAGAEPLIWMMDEAKQVGLKLCSEDVHACMPPATSPKGMGFWWIIECLPIGRVSFKAGNETKRVWWPHVGKGRRVMGEHKLHWTVFAGAKFSDNYKSQAVLKRKNDKNLTLEKIIDGNPGLGLDPKNYCEGGSYETQLEVLELLKKIYDSDFKSNQGGSMTSEDQVTLQSDRTTGSNHSDLRRLFELACSGQANIIWIYGGPQFLCKLVLSSIDDGPGMTFCEKIITSVVDPTRWRQLQSIWEEDMKMFKLPALEPHKSDEANEITFPRLRSLLKYCHTILEPVEHNSAAGYPIFSRLVKLTGFMGNSKLKPKGSDGDSEPVAAAKLAMIALEITSKLIDESLGREAIDHERDSIYVKELPLFLPLPPKPSAATEVLSNEILGVARATIRISAKIACHECYRRKLSAVSITRKLLPWFKYWDSVTSNVTADMVALIGSLTEDANAKAFLVHEGFAVDMMRCFAYCGDENKEKEALGVLTSLTYRPHDQGMLLRAADDKVIERLIDSMTTRLAPQAINTLANLTQYDNLRKNILDREIVRTSKRRGRRVKMLPAVLASLMRLPRLESKEIGPTSLADYNLSQSILVEGAKASIRLMVELATHEDSKAKLIKHKDVILRHLIELLERERDERERLAGDGTKGNYGAQPGPIIEHLLSAVPIFVLNDELRHPRFIETLVELSRTYGVAHHTYTERVFMAIAGLLNKGEDRHLDEEYELAEYEEIASKMISILVERASRADLSDTAHAEVAIHAMKKIIGFLGLGVSSSSEEILNFSINMMRRVISGQQEEGTDQRDNGIYPEDDKTDQGNDTTDQEEDISVEGSTAPVAPPNRLTILNFELIRALLTLPPMKLRYMGDGIKDGNNWTTVYNLVGQLAALGAAKDQLEHIAHVIQEARSLLPILKQKVPELRSIQGSSSTSSTWNPAVVAFTTSAVPTYTAAGAVEGIVPFAHTMVVTPTRIVVFTWTVTHPRISPLAHTTTIVFTAVVFTAVVTIETAFAAGENVTFPRRVVVAIIRIVGAK